jgi:hypothetical protein
VLLYPLVPLVAVGVLTSLWMIARGIMLATIARKAATDGVMRMFTLGWAGASVVAAIYIAVNWAETSILPLVYLLVAYALVWSALELVIGLYLRARARVLGRA